MASLLRESAHLIPRSEKDDLKLLESAISGNDPLHIVASCGALSLMPENASRLFRIEAMAHVAGVLCSNAVKSRIATKRLEELFCAPPLSGSIREAEDPFPNIFVEEVPFFGGAHRIFPGPSGGTAFSFRRLSECIFHDERRWPGDFISHTYQLIRGTLALSDLLAERAGLKRGTVGDSSEKGEVKIPTSKNFRVLREAVSFSREEFRSHLASVGVDAQELADLVANGGGFGLSDYSVSNGTLLHRPIIQCGEQFVIAAPQRLLSAVNHLISRRIVNSHLRDRYAQLYPESIMSRAHRCLGHLRHLRTNFVPNTLANIEGVREGFYLFDSDKILYLLVVCDTLEGFDGCTIDGIWGSPHPAEALVERAKQISTELLLKAAFANELFCVVIPSGVSRIHELLLNDWPDTMSCLAMEPDDLEIISQLEAGNPLVLWRFASKSDQALKKYRFLVFDNLDLFAAYRDRNYSYYPGDREAPEQIIVKPGYGTKLKVKVAQEQDWHPVRYFKPQFLVNVNTLYGSKAVPLYGLPDSSFPCVCIEELPCIVWVYPSEEIDDSKHSIYFEFAATVGYWVWQISPFLKQTIRRQMCSLQMIHVQISLSPSVVSSKSPGLGGTDEPAVLATATDLGTVNLSFEESFSRLLRLTENHAEREMLRQLIPPLVRASGAVVEVKREQVESVVERFAPLGLKRMLLHSEISHVPQLDPRDIPPYRPVQTGAAEDVIDEVSEHVTLAMGLKPGRIRPDVCNAALQDMVTFCFGEIARLVRALDPQGLLEYLISFNESLIRENSFKQISIATRMKTFEENDKILEEMARDMPEFAQAGVAGRFIIEFVAAQPPRGFRSMSLDVYDRLQALAAKLITFGSASDTLHSKLCDVEIFVRASGRIFVDNGAYSAALMMQLGRLASSRVESSDELFREHMGERLARTNLPIEDNDIDDAGRAEFGHSLTELVAFLNALGDVAMDLRPTTPAVMETGALIAALASELNWDREKIERCLALFCLSARETYLTPPAQMRREDLYPWRFNREVSYLRRPLILRERNGKSEILWGHRHLDVARSCLVQLCASMRLRAKSPEMRSLLAKFRHATGKRFNDEVYEVLQKSPHLVVRKQIRKVNHLRTGNLGDIDILCADLDETVLWVMECKSLAMARTPYEMSKELETLSVDTDEHPSIIKKHQARTAWVECHLRDILESIAVNSDLNWKVRPLIVMDTTPIGPLLRRLPIPVISIDMLKKRSPSVDIGITNK